MAMNLGHRAISFLAVLLVYGAINGRAKDMDQFEANYEVTWGDDHISFFDQRREVQLSMDVQSGSGFGSKLSYGSGLFHMRIKLPNKDSAGVVTAFYLSSNSNNHDELDLEFLGNREGKAITLQTNVFVNGIGNREQRMLLWFDPTADFHSYRILWNPYQIVFYVDDVPIRQFKNNINIGVGYPTRPMQIEASLWNGDSWATDGGQTKINWADSPFLAHFQGFDVDGCSSTVQNCNSSSSYWWNQTKFRKLDHNQQTTLEQVRQKYMNYDYCADRPRYPVPPPECNA